MSRAWPENAGVGAENVDAAKPLERRGRHPPDRRIADIGGKPLARPLPPECRRRRLGLREVRPTTSTCAPWCKTRATPRPMPRLPPVTMTDRPAMEVSI
jgi:hypothetical protein